MTGPIFGPLRLRSGVVSLFTLLGGISLAVVPASTVSIASRLFTVDEQGLLAVAVLVAAFVGQLVFAVVVESRLSSPATERRVVFPRWLAGLGVAVALILALLPPNAVLLAIGLPVLIATLEVGRGVSVAERLDRREIAASVLVGSGALAAVLAGFADQSWAFVPLLLGIAAATGIRAFPVAHGASRPDAGAMRWVVTDTAITGVVYPLLNLMILTMVGPADAVLFTSIATVSGLLAIPLNFLRLRLLKAHSGLDILVASGAVMGAVLLLLVLEWAGAFGFVFGAAWAGSATLVPLLLACAWRAASLATTIPFAALRRIGAVRLVTALRAVVSLLTFALAGLGLVADSLSAVFLGLLVAELASAALYEGARRRRAAIGRAGTDAADEGPIA